MRQIARVDLDELAGLRERAAQLCEETKSLIEENRSLRKWKDELRQKTLLTDAIAPACDPT